MPSLKVLEMRYQTRCHQACRGWNRVLLKGRRCRRRPLKVPIFYNWMAVWPWQDLVNQKANCPDSNSLSGWGHEKRKVPQAGAGRTPLCLPRGDCPETAGEEVDEGFSSFCSIPPLSPATKCFPLEEGCLENESLGAWP